MAPVCKEGAAPVQVFWIMRPCCQGKNYLPKLFWTREGVAKHLEKKKKRDQELGLPVVPMEVFYIDLGRKRIERVK